MRPSPPLSLSRTTPRRTAHAYAALAAGIAVLCFASAGRALPSEQDRRYRRFVWHVETLAGEPVSSRGADRLINPASVVKAATSLVALERLGPDRRFETRFFLDGRVDDVTGVLDGNLVVLGDADPDFHLDNVFEVARRLNERGVVALTGDVLVDEDFWLGWEGGSEGRRQDVDRRLALMAWRLKRALDPELWRREEREVWADYAERRGVGDARPPRVEVRGSYGRARGAPATAPFLVHRSKPLAEALQRFNAWSNNDIERVGDVLGGPDRVAHELADRLEVDRRQVRFETTSGLGENRMSVRHIVRLMRDLRATSRAHDLALDEVLPRAGCTEGTMENFPKLYDGEYARAVAGKTGTLFETDGGVSVLAGVASTASGDVLFAVARPRSGFDPDWERWLEQRFVVQLIDELGGPRARACPPAPSAADDGAVVYAPGELPAVARAPRLLPLDAPSRLGLASCLAP